MSAHQLHRSLARLNLRCFNVRPQRVQILRTPTAFYESLIERCDRATTRVTLSALYWGTGPLALNLAEAVARAASRGVAVNVTLDAARAGRRDKDGRTSVDALAAVLSRLRLSVLWWTTSGACAAHVSGQEWQRALLVLTTHAPGPGYHGSARARGIPLDARTGRLVGRQMRCCELPRTMTCGHACCVDAW